MKNESLLSGEKSINRTYRNWSVQGVFAGIRFLQILTWILVVLNGLVIYGIFFYSQGLIGYRQKQLQVKEAQERNEALKAENHHLFVKIKNAKTDTRAQERLVREQLGWVKDNEIVIEFLPKNGKIP